MTDEEINKLELITFPIYINFGSQWGIKHEERWLTKEEAMNIINSINGTIFHACIKGSAGKKDALVKFGLLKKVMVDGATCYERI